LIAEAFAAPNTASYPRDRSGSGQYEGGAGQYEGEENKQNGVIEDYDEEQ
jgi:hypothetical protein